MSFCSVRIRRTRPVPPGCHDVWSQPHPGGSAAQVMGRSDLRAAVGAATQRLCACGPAIARLRPMRRRSGSRAAGSRRAACRRAVRGEARDRRGGDRLAPADEAGVGRHPATVAGAGRPARRGGDEGGPRMGEIALEGDAQIERRDACNHGGGADALRPGADGRGAGQRGGGGKGRRIARDAAPHPGDRPARGQKISAPVPILRPPKARTRVPGAARPVASPNRRGAGRSRRNPLDGWAPPFEHARIRRR